MDRPHILLHLPDLATLAGWLAPEAALVSERGGIPGGGERAGEARERREEEGLGPVGPGAGPDTRPGGGEETETVYILNR